MFKKWFEGKTKIKIALLNVVSVIVIFLLKEKLGMSEETALTASEWITGAFVAVILGHSATDASANFGVASTSALAEGDPKEEPKPK